MSSFFRKFSAIEVTATIIFSFAVTALALVISLKQTIPPSYVDFIVGNITWGAQTKLQDLIVGPVLIISVLLSIFVTTHWISYQKNLFGNEHTEALSLQIIWWSLPTVISIAGFATNLSLERISLNISLAGFAFIFATSTYSASKKVKVNPNLMGLGLVFFLLLSLIPLEMILTAGRFFPSFVEKIRISPKRAVEYSMAVFVIIGLASFVCFPELWRRHLPKIALLGQIGASAFFFTIYPASLVAPDNSITNYHTTLALKILILGAIVLTICDVAYRYLKYRNSDEQTLFSLISPYSIFALLFAIKRGNTVAPYISSDDYHFGERILGWWSYLKGSIPYIDYIPPHGVVEDDVAGFISKIFFDGTAGSFDEANRLAFAIFGFVAYISILKVTRSIGLASLSVLFILPKYGWLFIIPFACIWLSRSLINRPTRWFAVWILTIPIVILGIPPQGIIIVAASGPIALYCLWNLYKKKSEANWKEPIFSIAILLIIAFATPFSKMLLGAISYVLENSSINQIAYGIPWHNSFRYDGFRLYLILFEARRMLWIAISITCFLLVYQKRKDPVTAFPGLISALFLMLLIPYSMGRIDPGNLSRPGSVTAYACMFFIPISFWRLLKPSGQAILILMVAIIGPITNFLPISFAGLVSSTASAIRVDDLTNGANSNIKNMGIATVDSEHWEHITSLNSLLNEKLEPGESYLDLTSRNAHYFYLDRKPSIAVTAPYNMASPSQQQHAIEMLSKNMPRLALLEANNIVHDGGGVALRNPLLFRFVIDNYIPALEGRFIVGYKKASESFLKSTAVAIPVKNQNDADWENGVNRTSPALVIETPELISLFKEGEIIELSTGDSRRIEVVGEEEGFIWLDGAPLDPKSVGFPNSVQIRIAPEMDTFYRVSLLEKAFSISDFHKIPVAWGKSFSSLAKKMSLVNSLEGLHPQLENLSPQGDWYRVGGERPSIIYDVSTLEISGHKAGLIKFDFRCESGISDPRIRVMWWGDNQVAPFHEASVYFTAENGTLIIPVDASPRWLTMKSIKAIGFDFENASSCRAISVRNIGVYQRNVFLTPKPTNSRIQ